MDQNEYKFYSVLCYLVSAFFLCMMLLFFMQNRIAATTACCTITINVCFLYRFIDEVYYEKKKQNRNILELHLWKVIGILFILLLGGIFVQAYIQEDVKEIIYTIMGVVNVVSFWMEIKRIEHIRNKKECIEE